jgi:hypothetical protein
MTAWGLDPDIMIAPEPGCYMVRFGPRRPEVPARIWVCTHEPGNPENEMDRGARIYYDAELSGQPADPYLVMRARSHRRIAEDEYRYQVACVAWALNEQRRDPRLHPTRLTDPRLIGKEEMMP